MKQLTKLSDEEVVVHVREVDMEAYAEIVDRYGDKLSRYVSYMVKDDDLAQSVVQNAFIKAYQNLNSFDVNKKFSSWIYRIAHNETISEVRGRKRLLYWPLEADFWGVFASSDNVEQELDDKLVQEWLDSCLSTLSEKYRGVLVLYYFEEKSYEEISEILGISVGTVGTRLNRGKKLVKQICKTKEAK